MSTAVAPAHQVTAARFGLALEAIAELFDLTHDQVIEGARKLGDFERFGATVSTVQGENFVLDPFQRLILLAYFCGFTEVMVLVSKGQGKTTLLALLQVYHLLTTPYPEVSVGAAVRAQAGKIYREASRIAALPRLRNEGRETPWRVPDGEGGVREVWLRPLPGYLEIRLGRRPEDGNMLVLSSDKLDTGTLEGLGPTLGVCEELHAHKSDAIYAAQQGGLHKRDGQMFCISTAGKRLDSVLGDIRAAAYRRGVLTDVPELGHLRVARIEHASIMFEWAVPEGADIDDMNVVKGANPATFVTVENLRNLRNSPGMTDSRWKRNHCGLWTAEAEGWLSGRAPWDRNATREERIREGDEIYLGVDPAWSFDTFSIVALKITGERKAYTEPLAIIRPAHGKTVSHRQVEAELLTAMRRYRVLAMGYDKNRGFAHVVENLSDEHGLTTVAVSMRGEVWVPLTAEMRTAVDDGSWTHPGDELYTAHVLGGETKSTGDGERLHGRTEEKVDALMATGIAWHTAFGLGGEGPISIYETRGML